MTSYLMEIQQFGGTDPRPVGVERTPEIPRLLALEEIARELSNFDRVRLFGAQCDVTRIPELEVQIDVVCDDLLAEPGRGDSTFSGDHEIELVDDIEAHWFDDFDPEAPVDVAGPHETQPPRTFRYVLTFAMLVMAACIGVVV